jgi:8-oxo-dGTP diphosphatase
MPIATVAAIIKNEEGKILLTRRNVDPFKEQWCLPGGHIDQFEPVRDAIVREVKEETGFDFKAEFFNYSDEIIVERDIHAVVMVFTGYGTGQLVAQKREVSNIGWFKLEEARSFPLAFEHNKILDSYALQMSNKETHAGMLAEYSSLRAEIL